MKAAELITVGVPGRGDLVGCSVPDLRECLDGSRRARAVLDAFDTRIVSLIETATRAVGMYEQHALETSMRSDVLSPNARWVACSGFGNFCAGVAASAWSVPTSSYGQNLLAQFDDDRRRARSRRPCVLLGGTSVVSVP